jgi:ceramide glucosyltransferase
VIYLLTAIAAAAALYQALVLAGAVGWLRRRDPLAQAFPPVSILKPVHGLDPDFYDCILSHAQQHYPEFEILFGVSDPADPAIPEIERLISGFPRLPIRLIHCTTPAPNAKAGILIDLAAAARYGILLVNDSDIRVPPDYLRRVVPPLQDPSVGVVTCLYRARARSWPSRFEATAIATDFVPGVLAAPLAGVSGFALGATMVFRASDLARIGGFAALADYLADDYQLGRLISGLGRRVVLSRCVVETSLSDNSWAAVWRHQVRWARTIRVSRGGGYLGMPLANTTLWAVVAGAAGHWPVALALAALRLATGFICSVAVLRDSGTAISLCLMYFRDIAGLAIWAAGLAGSTVTWRGARLRLVAGGRIAPDLTQFPATR